MWKQKINTERESDSGYEDIKNKDMETYQNEREKYTPEEYEYNEEGLEVELWISKDENKGGNREKKERKKEGRTRRKEELFIRR